MEYERTVELDFYEDSIREHEFYWDFQGLLREERFYTNENSDNDEFSLWSHKTYTYSPDLLTIEIRDACGPFSGSPARAILSYDNLRHLSVYSEWDSEVDMDFQCWYDDDDNLLEEIFYNGGATIFDRRLLCYGEQGCVLEEHIYDGGYYSKDSHSHCRFIYQRDESGHVVSTTSIYYDCELRVEHHQAPDWGSGATYWRQGGPWWAWDLIRQWRKMAGYYVPLMPE